MTARLALDDNLREGADPCSQHGDAARIGFGDHHGEPLVTFGRHDLEPRLRDAARASRPVGESEESPVDGAALARVADEIAQRTVADDEQGDSRQPAPRINQRRDSLFGTEAASEDRILVALRGGQRTPRIRARSSA